MLRSLNEVVGYVLAATDGDIGRCKDFLFDDRRWTVRYMVADTGKWLPGRKVLISPAFLRQPEWSSRLFPVSLSKDEIQHAPELAEDAPVSLQHEQEVLQYYGYPFYWYGEGLWGAVPTPYGMALAAGEPPERSADKSDDQADHHLRSAGEVKGYAISARDESIGHVEDFVLDDETWQLTYVVVDTRDWLPGGKKVLVAPDWVAGVDWAGREVSVSLTADSIRNSPPYDPLIAINREYEKRLYDFYGRPYPR